MDQLGGNQMTDTTTAADAAQTPAAPTPAPAGADTAQPADGTTPSLAPNVKPDPNSPFFMSQESWHSLQCYLKSGMELSTSPADAVVKMGIAQEDADKFADLWAAYKQVQDHCADFRKTTLPDTVNLAGSLAEYGRDKAPIFYAGLLQATDPNDFKDVLANLRQTAVDFAADADKVRDEINDFIDQTTKDKATLSPILDKYKQEYDGEQGLITQYRTEIQDDTDLIDHFNDEYRKDVTIACTSATYAWVFPVGTIAAAVVAGVYGKRAQDALDHVHEYQDKLAGAQERLRSALVLSHDLDLVDKSLDGIIASLNDALPVVQKMKGIWTALAKDIDLIVATIDKDISGMPRFIQKLGIKEAIQEWQDLAAGADQFRVNAFVEFLELNEVKAKLAADPNAFGVPKAA